MTREIGAPRGGPEASPENISRAIIKFALIEAIGVLALLGFFLAYFVFGVFPGQPPNLLIFALLGFAAWAVFAFWASGLLRQITAKSSTNAR